MKKILLVDDSGLARRLVRKMLEDHEYTIEEAASGPEALEACALNQYDLVILDMLMSGMYGLEVLQKLKELNPSLPVIVATADIQRTTRDQVRDAGAAAMLNKPVNKEELMEMLDLVWKGETSWN
jgi:two-component system, chemotaxis family, chemotaxis protein CheY